MNEPGRDPEPTQTTPDPQADADAEPGPEGNDPATPGDVPAGVQYGGDGSEAS